MSRKTTKLLKAALSTLHYSRADELMAPFTQGVGVIFMLHQVTPEQPADFEPNRILKITPDFLEDVIGQVQKAGFDIVSLDEASFRMGEGQFDRPFACFTFDDGYRDNAQYAYPIFARHNLPFAIYVPSDYADGHGDLWWLALEKVLAMRARLSLKIDGHLKEFSLDSVDEKNAAFHEIYWWLRRIDEDAARQVVRDLCDESGFDARAMADDLLMDWDEIRQLARDPLVTIGAHTCGHYALARLSAARSYAQMARSVERIERELGRPCRHFSYPYGCEASAGPREFAFARELGLKTAVTTRKGPVYTEHGTAMTALPRLSLNGDYQDLRYVKVLLSGAPFAFWRMLKKVVPARRPALTGVAHV